MTSKITTLTQTETEVLREFGFLADEYCSTMGSFGREDERLANVCFLLTEVYDLDDEVAENEAELAELTSPFENEVEQLRHWGAVH